MDRMRSLYSGHKGKLKLLYVLTKSAGITSSISLYETDSVIVDGFGMLHLLQKTDQIKTGVDLVNGVYLWVDNKTKFCSTTITAFDTYQEMSPKSATRNERYSKSNPQHYNITSSTNISRQSMSQLLTHKKNKPSGSATNGPIERLFITQRFVICSSRKFYHTPFYVR